jgi:4-hydroxy-2-oxoheptanedioate aldolase
VDFVYADQQHNPLDFTGLHIFLLGMTDRGMVLKKGSLQPNVALFARSPTEAAQSGWIVQQALDMGLMGFIFTDVGTKQDAMAAVQMMRYPQMKGTKYFEPAGKRGNSAANATWIWGLDTEEYMRRADVWPLNPDGDLLAIMMVEGAEGLKNVDEIASVPGVGAIFVGAGGDLHLSLGVRQDSAELEAAFQRILASCKAHNVACAISANTGADVARRVREGWKIIRSTVPAITAGRALLGEQQ